MEDNRAADSDGSGRKREVLGERPSEAVLFAIAEVRGCDPTDLPPLNGVIDPEALDDLFSVTAGGDSRCGGRLAFEYADCRVVVLGGERVHIQKSD
jgi:hypothetical protein